MGDSGEPETVDFNAYLNSLPRLLAEKLECSEKSITAAEKRSVVSGCVRGKSPGLDGVPYELYGYIPGLFVPLLADVYRN